MVAQQTEAGEGSKWQRFWRRRWLKRLVAVALAVLIFSFGVGVGDGRIAFSTSTPVSGSLPSSLNYASVNQVYNSLKDNYDGQLTTAQLLNGLKHGLANATNDPYTEYFTPAEAKAFNDELNNSFSGIGAELGEDGSGDIEVIAPIAGTPAAKAGLKAQDLIAAINGKSTSGMSVDDAVNAIRGPAGSVVKLQVVRDKSQALTFNIKRQNITVPSVNYKLLAGNLGYIQISTFADDTTGLIQKAAGFMAGHHVKGIVLDLRDNPGGEVNAAQAVSSEWLQPNQLIMQEKRGNSVIQSYYASGGDQLHGIPTVVLVNGGSASASEITAGALHDQHDAVIYGTKSYGKGVVQQIINFSDGSELKVTIASWYRPDGQNINHKGITPDKTIPPTKANTKNGADPQLTTAETYLAKH